VLRRVRHPRRVANGRAGPWAGQRLRLPPRRERRPSRPSLNRPRKNRLCWTTAAAIFRPHCMKSFWHVKQAYSIVNSDPVAQNVAFNAAGRPRRPTSSLPVGGKATHKFTRKPQSSPIPIACNYYHPWERAYVLPARQPLCRYFRGRRHVPHPKAAGGPMAIPSVARKGRLSCHAPVGQRPLHFPR